MTKKQVEGMTSKQKLRLLKQLVDCTHIVITASYSEREKVESKNIRLATVSDSPQEADRMVKDRTILIVTSIMTG